MSTAAEWSRISAFPRTADDHGRTIGTFSVTNLSWAQQRATMQATPLFGGRREWPDYAAETTGYGSLELGGPLAYRVTIVAPGDEDALRGHHRLIRTGRPGPRGTGGHRRQHPRLVAVRGTGHRAAVRHR
jgi:hypothetical protein